MDAAILTLIAMGGMPWKLQATRDRNSASLVNGHSGCSRSHSQSPDERSVQPAMRYLRDYLKVFAIGQAFVKSEELGYRRWRRWWRRGIHIFFFIVQCDLVWVPTHVGRRRRDRILSSFFFNWWYLFEVVILDCDFIGVLNARSLRLTGRSWLIPMDDCCLEASVKMCREPPIWL